MSWAFNVGSPTSAQFILRYKTFKAFASMVPLIHAVHDAGYHVEQSTTAILYRETEFQVGSNADPAIPRIHVDAKIANVVPHHDRVVCFLPDAAATFYVPGKGYRHVMSPVVSRTAGTWVWNVAGGEPVQVGFEAWLRHYYPAAAGGIGLPAGVSRARALVWFVLGGFPQGNTIGLTQATWDALPAL